MIQTQQYVLKVQDLSKNIGKATIIHNVSFELERGEILGLLGPNGSGKTTILKMIVGLLRPSAGTITVSGHNIQTSFEKGIQHIGAIIENPEMYDYLSGYDNLIHYVKMSKNVGIERIEEVTNVLKMRDYIDDKVRTYSLGMKQRLGLAQALLHNPSILLLDEPTNGLDPQGMKELRQLLIELAENYGVAVIISSHQLAEIELICDSIIVIQDGRVIEKSELKDEGDELESHPYEFKIFQFEQVKSNIESLEIPRVSFQKDGFQTHLTEVEVADLNKRLINHEISVVGIRKVATTLEDRFIHTLKGSSK